MLLTLKEKRLQKIRTVFRIAVFSMNTAGMFLCLHIASILTAITGKREAAGLFNKLFFGGGFLPEEFDAVIRAAQMVIFILIFGLCIVIYCLLAHEVQSRLRIHQLLHCIGYTRLQVFFYEFAYEMWDLFFGFTVSAAIYTILVLWITGNGSIAKMSKTVPLYLGNRPLLYVLVLFILSAINMLCCILQAGIRKKK